MHTFFINTAKNKPDHYESLCEIEKETRKIIFLDCPFSLWQDEKRGYKGCISSIGEIIDNYKDVASDYNLIVYVDLLEIDLYARRNKNLDLNLAYYGIMPLVKRYVASTLQEGLIRSGRSPQSTVIVFDEKMRKDEAPGSDDTVDRELGEILLESMGFSLTAEFKACKDLKNEEDFLARVESLYSEEKEILAGLRSLYEEKLQEALRTGIRDSATHFRQVAIALKRAVLDEARADGMGDVDIDAVCLASNRFAGGENTKENARRFLRLYAYLIDCANNGTHRPVEGKGEQAKSVPALSDATLQRVCDALYKKQCNYYALHLETKDAKDEFSQLGLAPPLYKLDCEKFGLNESGFPAKVVTVSETEREDENNESPKESAEEDVEDKDAPSEVKVGGRTRRQVASEKKEVASVFEDDEFSHFDYFGDDIKRLIEEDGTGSAPEGKQERKKERKNKKLSGSPEKIGKRYERDALSIRQNHTEYLEKLKKHLNGIHSHYAGRSLGDKPAILKKRVYEKESFFADENKERVRRYAVKPMDSKTLGRAPQKESARSGGAFAERYVRECEDEENVRDLAQNAYNTVQQEYLRFCAGRSVALTDIDEQCSWFLTRLEQIKESLKKIGTVGMGLFFAMLVVFLPFVLVQWTAITENALTVAVAAGSFVLPLAILYVIYTVISLRQKQEFEKAWKEFKEKSRQALEENAEAVKQYDRLLSALIPSLRWVYEYKLDVEQYVNCCRLAKAKRKHHEDKLLERSETVGNLLEDLEYGAEKVSRPTVDKKSIDYGKAFSVGDKNTKLYAVLDQELLEIIMEGRDK